MNKCVHHYLLAVDPETGAVTGRCKRCQQPMPAWKASNVDKRAAASRKSNGNGRDWRGRAMTVRT